MIVQLVAQENGEILGMGAYQDEGKRPPQGGLPASALRRHESCGPDADREEL